MRMTNYRITATTAQVPEATSKLPILSMLALTTDFIGIPLWIAAWSNYGFQGFFAMVLGVPCLLFGALMLALAGCARQEPLATPTAITQGVACLFLLGFIAG
jgi:hypothetical protein